MRNVARYESREPFKYLVAREWVRVLVRVGVIESWRNQEGEREREREGESAENNTETLWIKKVS